MLLSLPSENIKEACVQRNFQIPLPALDYQAFGIRMVFLMRCMASEFLFSVGRWVCSQPRGSTMACTRLENCDGKVEFYGTPKKLVTFRIATSLEGSSLRIPYPVKVDVSLSVFCLWCVDPARMPGFQNRCLGSSFAIWRSFQECPSLKFCAERIVCLRCYDLETGFPFF